MARINGQLKFPINELKNPALGGAPTANTPPLAKAAPIDDPLIRPSTQATNPNPQAKQPAIRQSTQAGNVAGAIAPIEQRKVTPSVQTLTPSDPVIPTAQPKAVQPVVTPPVPVAAPVPTETRKEIKPVEDVELSQAQTDIEQLNTFAKDALTATEDPVSDIKFNTALTNIGLGNQASRDLLQMQINANPDLVGQPAGTALLTHMARQQGFDTSNLISKLSIESADRIDGALTRCLISLSLRTARKNRLEASF